MTHGHVHFIVFGRLMIVETSKHRRMRSELNNIILNLNYLMRVKMNNFTEYLSI